MAATFTNTDGVGWESTILNSTSTAGPVVTAPTDLADGLLGFAVMSQDGSTTGTLTVSNVTGEVTEVALANTTDGNPTLYVGYWEQSGSPAASHELNNSGASNEQEIGAVIAISGYDTGAPVKESTTNTGNGTSATFPASTVAATSNDLVFRIIATDSDVTLSSMPDTTVLTEKGGSFNTALGISFAAGTGATPGTDTCTLSKTESWVTATVIVAGAGGGGSTSDVNYTGANRGIARGVMRGVG